MKCENCLYFDAGLKECHRNPPELDKDLDIGRWPPVVAHEWCGEYIQKELWLMGGTERGPVVPMPNPYMATMNRIDNYLKVSDDTCTRLNKFLDDEEGR